MPATLGQLVRNLKRIDIPLEEGASLFIVYRPGAITPKMEARLQEFKGRDTKTLTPEEQNRAKSAILDYIEATVYDWDLNYPVSPEHPKGGKVPPNRDGLGDMFYDELIWLVEQIQGDQNTGEANGAK